MALAHSPSIVMNGLVLCLDAGNIKSFDDDENLITHSSMSGWTVGVLGSGGALPTGWGLDQQQPGSTIQIIGGGVEDGLNYVDIRFFATSVSTSNRTLIRPGNSVTTDGSTYYLTTYSKLVSGSTNNLTHINFHTGALSLTNVLTRNIGASAVLSGTFFPRYDIGYNGTGVAYDITIRFAAPQLERGSSASPYYATTSTAKNRGTILTDLTGRGNNGTLTNSPTYNSANGGSIVFDGADDVVNSTTSIIDRADGQEITVSCWIKPSRTSGQYSVFCTNRSDNTAIYNWIFYQHTTDGAIAFHGDAQNKSSYVPTINVWINVTNTVTASGVSTLYVNGVSTYTVTGYTYGNGTPSRLGIGADPGGQEPFQGNISQVQIYNRALSAAEIQQNFNALRGRFGV